jgi:hypothetical protein
MECTLPSTSHKEICPIGGRAGKPLREHISTQPAIQDTFNKVAISQPELDLSHISYFVSMLLLKTSS